MFEQAFHMMDAWPGPSSQTTADCLSNHIPVGDEYLMVDKPSLHSESFVIEVPTSRTWDEVVDEVLVGRAEAWKRLAEL